MRIRTFCKFIEEESTMDHTLQNCSVVIDAYNFFYGLYEKSGLEYIFGCESDKYADYLKTYLSMFKKANIKCYFIFKGGHEDFAKIRKKKMDEKTVYEAKQKCFEQEEIVLPIFMKDVYKQVLDEMGFNYTITQYESKNECIAFAQKHKCSLISYDIEYCFAGVNYIPHTSLKFDESNNSIQCKLYTVEILLKKFRLTQEKLSIFIVLTDENIFPENHFMNFILWLKVPLGYYKRNKSLLCWLSRTSTKEALEKIFNHLTTEDQQKFSEEENKLASKILKQCHTGFATEYLENENFIQIHPQDPHWFEKGIISKHINVQLVNLYHEASIFGSWAIKNEEDNDPLWLSKDLIVYMYNLLTNFQQSEIKFLIKEETIPILSSSKPKFDADENVFKNGWSDIHLKKLFEHFLLENLQLEIKRLEQIPEDARLLMIALIFFSSKKPAETANEVYSALLSYVALNMLFLPNEGLDNIDADLTEKPLLDTTTDINFIDKKDIVTAGTILKTWIQVSRQEARKIFDVKLIHPLVELQHCLQNMNILNKLCGCPYKSTIYSKTYNGTFVYKILHVMQNEYGGNGLNFLKSILNPAPTVLAFVNGLIECYEQIMFT